MEIIRRSVIANIGNNHTPFAPPGTPPPKEQRVTASARPAAQRTAIDTASEYGSKIVLRSLRELARTTTFPRAAPADAESEGKLPDDASPKSLATI